MKPKTDPSAPSALFAAPGWPALNIREESDDWLQTLFAKRRRGRRMSPDLLPPYSTGDGLILVDRRSRHDRRMALDQTKSITPSRG